MCDCLQGPILHDAFATTDSATVSGWLNFDAK